jgi:NhaA family Na+:H+ antiporter
MGSDAGRRRGLPGLRRLRTAAPRLSQFALEHLLLLPLGAAIALVWVHVDPERYFQFRYAASFLVNDVAMVFFFALMTKEVVEATAPGGVLHSWRRALLPIAGAIGATIVPALMHVRAVAALDEPMLAAGWPIPFAVDIAFGYLVARIIFRRHPAIPFFILLAIASNALGFGALALAQATGGLNLAGGVMLLVIAMSIAGGLRRAGVKNFWAYLLTAGALSWFALFWSGLHPALALVPIVPFLPHGARDPGFLVDADPRATDTLSRFEIWWRYPAQVALFFFGLVNAGVPIGAYEAGAWGLPIAVLAGKPIGLVLASGAAVLAGLRLPGNIGWRELTVVGFVAAIGFSVGLFFCAVLLPPGQLRSEMSMGVLLSLAGAPLAVVSAMLLGVGRFARQDTRHS